MRIISPEQLHALETAVKLFHGEPAPTDPKLCALASALRHSGYHWTEAESPAADPPPATALAASCDATQNPLHVPLPVPSDQDSGERTD